MKLYATMASERARKNQGGNKYVDIDLFTGSVDNSKHFANVRLNIIDGVYTLWLDGEIVKQDKGRSDEEYLKGIYHKFDKPEIVEKMLAEKGERQKGETCLTCGNTGWLSKGEKCLNCNPLGNH